LDPSTSTNLPDVLPEDADQAATTTDDISDVVVEGKSSPRRLRSKGSSKRAVTEWMLVLAIALVAAFLVRTYLFQTFYIPSASMQPTLQIGDRIIVSKVTYDFRSVERGDIIVFRAPPAEHNDCGDPGVTDLVKRVMGLPGEVISSRGNNVTINGKVVPEPWFPATPLGPAIGTMKIPAGHYFVMGDNRTNSCDSRTWGTVPKPNIIGHVVFRIWPVNRIGFP